MRERTPVDDAGAGSSSGATLPPPVASWDDVTGYVDPDRGEPAAAGSRDERAAGAGPAERIGRYIVLRELGRGGMGVTYVAYDEVLDRKVAIKLVRADAMNEQAQIRLQREARALARLAHPNIVAVHDVGVHGSQPFIAMELVPGQTVSAWLAAHRPPMPEAGPIDDQLTGSGSLVGTLAYMAPEHLELGVADARSDQFALCVSLFEALYRRQPFAGTTPRARLALMHGGMIAEVPGPSEVPAWLHAAVVRGLACEPEARWPSMDALLAELGRDPTRPRFRAGWIATAAAGAVMIAAAVGFAVASHEHAVCTGAQAQIDEVWNQQQRAAIERAMLATDVSYAAETWQRTAALLDRYALDWAAAHTEACEATAVREEQSEEVLDQRMQCLARRRRSLRALVGELTRIDAESIARATEAAGHLPLISACGDIEYLVSRVEPPADPQVAARVDALEAELSRAEQLQELGRYEQGLDVAQAAVEAAAGLSYPPSEARARLHLGMLQLAIGDYPPAESNLKEAHLLARIANDHEVALQAATQLVYLLGPVSRLDDAEDWGRHVRAELPWVSSEALQASSLNTLGVLALLQGKHEQAIDLCNQALARWQRALGPEHAENANALNNLGVVFHALGRYAESAEHHRRALEVTQRALGMEHPRVARSLNNLGGALYRQRKYAEAIEHYARALAITEEMGAEHPLLADPLTGLALTYVEDGRAVEALPLAERALAVLERHDTGPETLAEARFVLARALMAVGQEPQRALALARQARDAMQAASGSLSLIDLASMEAWLRTHEPRP